MMSPASYTSAVPVVPSDATVLKGVVGLYVGGAGAVSVVMAGEGNAAAVFSAVPAGTVLPIAVKQVKATGTVATLILALR